MDLSIIIVNYNAKAFLNLCLQSVHRATKEVSAEVIVVDNASSDGAPEMVKRNHSWIRLIENKINVGFSKANNQAIREAKGKIVVIQNPDTIVAEDTYKKCLSFLSENQKAGSCGARMLDGSGAFLPESKRGIPTPMTSFFKAFGLAKRFPKSTVFSRYYLGHLSPSQNQQVEILSGAFLCIKKEALEKAGLFDEDFFMFGEDIDLSYRILKAGYENWYLAEAPILHFKGESSRKADEKYLNSFFGAMDIFYKKHFSNNGGWMIKQMVSIGIWLKRNHFKQELQKKDRISTSSNNLPSRLFVVMKQNWVSPSYLSDESTMHRIKSIDSLKRVPRGSSILFTKEQSFKEIISFMDVNPGRFKYLFQSNDATFVLGSPEKDHPGIVYQ